MKMILKSVRVNEEEAEMIKKIAERIRPKASEQAIMNEGVRMAIEYYGKQLGLLPKNEKKD